MQGPDNMNAINPDAVEAGQKSASTPLDIRDHADALEDMVADDLWPLPTYQEMLFIK